MKKLTVSSMEMLAGGHSCGDTMIQEAIAYIFVVPGTGNFIFIDHPGQVTVIHC